MRLCYTAGPRKVLHIEDAQHRARFTHANDSARNVPVELVSLTAISPLDGRYGRQTADLRDIFSEFAFMRERLRVEIAWLTGLASLGLSGFPAVPDATISVLQQLVSDFSIDDCIEIKAIEAETNHDV